MRLRHVKHSTHVNAGTIPYNQTTTVTRGWLHDHYGRPDGREGVGLCHIDCVRDRLCVLVLPALVHFFSYCGPLLARGRPLLRSLVKVCSRVGPLPL